MKAQRSSLKNRTMLAIYTIGVAALATAAAGCTTYDPQGAAQQAAPSYYNQPYSQLSPEQKMGLEDHLSNQSNQAWRTTADVASSVGHLAQGTGILLYAVRH
jgi:hypothetical protein